MTRPLDDLLRDFDAAIAETDRGADILPAGQRAFRALAALLRECRAALATAREDGAREEREAVVAALEGMVVGGRAWTEGQSIAAHALLDAASGIASGKHRPS